MSLMGLFVYGTLHPDRAPAEVRAITREFVLLGTGTVQGRLLDLGAFPGLVLDSLPGQTVSGHVFLFPPAALTGLDAYEGFLPDQPAYSLFFRRTIAVTRESGFQETHWVYVYGGHRRLPLRNDIS
jgi:gamma-glutamylcyclotransferase (GGCT)/AIG2-like uncharacterized protein YtfP